MTTRTSTTDEILQGEGPAAVAGRRLVLTLVLLAVLFNLGGALGVRTETVTSSSNGYTLTLSYPETGRAGLDVRWQVVVRHDGGFERELTLAVTGDYFEIFETQGFFPEPSSQIRDDEMLYLTFDTPAGEVFTLDYDAYIQPASQRGREGRVAVVGDSDGGVDLVAVDYRTRLVP